ncbi:MAG TPA: 1-acyl-sn-glycerol-3-phosphate acyltransferase [Bauldia sp.]|nr:1-acyl-sn-glycerol-3-phosphate acyltransferase [Bauldia sp.]
MPPSATPTPANRNTPPDLALLANEAMVRAMARKGAGAVPSIGEVLRRRLPFMAWIDSFVFRAVMLVARRQIIAITGIEHILNPGPFVLALNHSIKREAIIVPAALIFHRGGRLIHFWSDWVYRIVPGLGFLLRRAGTIAVMTKPGNPRILDLLRPFFSRGAPAIEQARAHLRAGRPIGVFPEGTANRDRRRLLGGRHGAARLSLEVGVPVVPVGIVFPKAPAAGAIPESAAMEIRIGRPLVPPRTSAPRPSLVEVRAWHATVMTEIARLSGKTWSSEPAA